MRRAVLATALLVLAGCSSSPARTPSPGSSGATGDSGGGSPAAPLTGLAAEGIYGIAPIGTQTAGTVSGFGVAAGCPEVARILTGSQWRTTDAVIPPSVHYVWLSLGKRRALAQLADAGPTACQLMLTTSVPENVSLSGSATAKGQAQLVNHCAHSDLSDTSQETIGGYYSGPGDVEMSVGVDIKPGTKPGRLTGDSAEVVALHGISFIEMAALQTAGHTPSPAQIIGDFSQSDGSTATVDITSVKPLEGTITLHALVDDSGDTPRTLDVSVGFHCDDLYPPVPG